MNTLRAMTCASLLALSSPLLAQDGHQHHGGADTATPAAEASPAKPASPATSASPEKSGGGMSHGGGKMGHGGMHGKQDCKGMMGGAPDAALERRIGELEKRLDLMQLMLQREAR
jgi:hypothetical protein